MSESVHDRLRRTITSLHGQDLTSIETVDIAHESELRFLTDLNTEVVNLKTLTFTNIRNFNNLMLKLNDLTHDSLMSIRFHMSPCNIPFPEFYAINKRNLRDVTVTDSNFTSLKEMKFGDNGLFFLCLRNCIGFDKLAMPSNMNVTNMVVMDCNYMTKLSFRGMRKMKELEIIDNTRLEKVDITNMGQSLRRLKIEGCPTLTDPVFLKTAHENCKFELGPDVHWDRAYLVCEVEKTPNADIENVDLRRWELDPYFQHLSDTIIGTSKFFLLLKGAQRRATKNLFKPGGEVFESLKRNWDNMQH